MVASANVRFQSMYLARIVSRSEQHKLQHNPSTGPLTGERYTSPMSSCPRETCTQSSHQTRTRWDLAVAALIFSGLAVVLVLASAVMVRPSLAGDLHPWWPALAGLGLLSTVAGFWWLWWRPR